jgi:hypothetical protein
MPVEVQEYMMSDLQCSLCAEYPEHCPSIHAKKCMDEFGRERLPADLVHYLDTLATYVRHYVQRKRLLLMVKHMRLERRKRLYGNPLRIMMLLIETPKDGLLE